MKTKECPQEKNIIQGLRSGLLKQEIEKHIAECPSCRETAHVAFWMRNYAGQAGEVDAEPFTPPHPEILWTKAHAPIYIDRDKVKKVLKPLRYGRIFSFAAAAFGILLFITYGPPNELSSAARLFASTLQKISSYLFPFIMVPLAITLLASLFFIIGETISHKGRSFPAG